MTSDEAHRVPTCNPIIAVELSLDEVSAVSEALRSIPLLAEPAMRALRTLEKAESFGRLLAEEKG